MNDSHRRIVVIIPARYQSSRFPGKPLAILAGKPMIQWVYERALMLRQISEVWVATDDTRISDCVQSFGGQVILTARHHLSGTDRLAEAAKILRLNQEDIVVNIQGDQPIFPSRLIDPVIAGLLNDPLAAMSTPAHLLSDPQAAQNPNLVKVVFNHQNHDLYFSRAPIPYWREAKDVPQYYKHIGIYVYRYDFLEHFVKLPPGRWEMAEKLEQLRALEYGFVIKVIETDAETLEVDEPADTGKVEALLQKEVNIAEL
jgi:3-deoxy-manno-octulosonate cytidylyltransferase (CMP-KDO synthetase)